MARRESDDELLDVFFTLAGERGGRAGRLRVWSAIALLSMAVVTAFGGFAFWGGTPSTVSAAAIERGYRPRLYFHRTFRADERYAHQVTGRLDNADSVVFDDGGVAWRCAPLVSGRAGADAPPRVYYAASETHYRRARAENRFAGLLNTVSPPTSQHPAMSACGAPADGYVLIDDGSLRTWRETGRSLMTIGGVLGSIALAAFLFALLRRSAEPDPPTDAAPSAGPSP
jgi:hypothetical protein